MATAVGENINAQMFSRGGDPKFYLDEEDGIDSSHRTEPQCDHEHNDAHYVTGRGSVVAQSGESQEEATGNTGRVNKNYVIIHLLSLHHQANTEK